MTTTTTDYLSFPPPTRVLVTPAMAVDWMKHNINNRNPNKKKIEKGVEHKNTGKFLPNRHNTIKFRPNGDLADGQGRLQIIIDSGMAEELLVIYDLTDEELDLIDGGQERNQYDRDRLHGATASDIELATCYMAETGKLVTRQATDATSIDRARQQNRFLVLAQEVHAELNGVYGLSQYPVYAAIVRVLEKQPQDETRILQFCAALRGDQGIANYLSAYTLKQTMQLKHNRLVSNKQAKRLHLFRITMLALRDFIDNKDTQYDLTWFEESLHDLPVVW